MADQILNAVIRLEAQLEQQLEAEQNKADRWLGGVRREQAATLEQARQEQTRSFQVKLREAERQAEQQAEATLQNEVGYCRRLAALEEQTLLEVLRRQLVAILPRQVDDHQNDES